MLRLIARRLLLGLFILFGVSVFVFILLHLAPGDAARAIAGPYASEDVVEVYRARYGLDRPLPIQYVQWLGRVLRGDLGHSPTLGTPVGPLVLSRFRNTFVLAGSSFLIAVLLGMVVGVVAGTRPRSAADRAVMSISLFLANTPPYLFGLILVYLFALRLDALPSGGMYDLRDPGGAPDLLIHLLLPAFTVSLGPMAVIARMTRGSILEISQKDYVKMALASGIPGWRVIVEYMLLNALAPIISVIGLQVGTLLAGAVFAEVVFSWPGVGSQLYTAVIGRDMPTVQAATLVIAVSFVLVNLVTDIAVLALDPRTRHG